MEKKEGEHKIRMKQDIEHLENNRDFPSSQERFQEDLNTSKYTILFNRY
jgi:hypothetical protein